MKKIVEKLYVEKPAHLNEFINSIENVKKELGYITTEMDLRGKDAIEKHEYKKNIEFSKISQILHEKQQKIDYILGNSINNVRQKPMKKILEIVEEAKSQYLNDLIGAISRVKGKLIYIREDIDDMAARAKDNREYKKDRELCEISNMVCKKIDEIDDILNFSKTEQMILDNVNKSYEGEECSLFSDGTYKKPLSFTYRGENYTVKSWRDMLLKVCRILYKENNMLFELIPNDINMRGKKCKIYSFSKGELREPEKIEGTRIYVETNMSANQILKEIIKLLDRYGMNYNDFKIYVKES